MINQPAGHDLLAIARRTLLDAIVPALPADKTYDALMIANAMAMAMRELEQGARDPEAELVHAFLQQNGLPATPQATNPEAHLAQLIRQQRIPASLQANLHGLLQALARTKLGLSNPKYLKAG